MNAFEQEALRAALDALRKILRGIYRRLSKKSARRALSAVVTEVLKIDPDIDVAKARLAAIEAVGETPSPEFLRAERLVKAAETYSTTWRKVTRKKAAHKRVVRKTARRKVARRARAK